MQLWAVFGETLVGAIITQIEVNPNFLVLQIVHAGGEHFPEWINVAVNKLEAFGRKEGCEYIQAHGRPGWYRYAKDQGFSETYRVYSKRLDDG